MRWQDRNPLQISTGDVMVQQIPFNITLHIEWVREILPSIQVYLKLKQHKNIRNKYKNSSVTLYDNPSYALANRSRSKGNSWDHKTTTQTYLTVLNASCKHEQRYTQQKRERKTPGKLANENPWKTHRQEQNDKSNQDLDELQGTPYTHSDHFRPEKISVIWETPQYKRIPQLY